jgi:cytochrome c-type biogenesis protein
LLLIYSFGLGLPFLLTGVLIDRITPLFRRASRYLGVISLGSGAMLVLMGILVLSGSLAQLAQYSPLLGG